MAVDLASISFAAVLVAAGMAAFALAALYRPARNRLLISFGAFVVLYGYRTFADMPAVRAAVGRRSR